MPITVDDITPIFLAFWEQAEDQDLPTQRRLWHDLYEAPNRAIFDALYRSHGNPDDLDAALNRYPAIVPGLRESMPQLHRRIEAAWPHLASLFQAAETDLRFVLLVGLFHSDGWVEEIAGSPVCFCAVEAVEDLGTAHVLLAHEAAHGYHLLVNPTVMTEMANVGHALFVEGLAVLASARIAPGLDAATYLWAGRRTTPAGQAVAEWLAEAEAAWPSLRSDLLRDLSATDDATYAAYFLGSRERPTVPLKAGYLAGYRLVAELAQRHSIAELARWPLDRAYVAITDALAGDGVPLDQTD